MTLRPRRALVELGKIQGPVDSMDLPLVVPDVPLEEVEALPDGKPAGHRMPEARPEEVSGFELKQKPGNPSSGLIPAAPQRLERFERGWSD